MTKLVRLSRPGTPPYVRVISGAFRLAPPAVLVEAVAAVHLEALLPLLAQLLVLVPRLVVVLRAQLLLPLEAEVALEEVELHRSFSAAMVESLPSLGKPRYAAVPRSGRKPNCRLYPLA
jgi:hypothetical protein